MSVDVVFVDHNQTVLRMLTRVLHAQGLEVATTPHLEALPTWVAADTTAPLIFVNITENFEQWVGRLRHREDWLAHPHTLVLTTARRGLIARLRDDQPFFAEILERPFRPADILTLCQHHCTRVREGIITLTLTDEMQGASRQEADERATATAMLERSRVVDAITVPPSPSLSISIGPGATPQIKSNDAFEGIALPSVDLPVDDLDVSLVSSAVNDVPTQDLRPVGQGEAAIDPEQLGSGAFEVESEPEPPRRDQTELSGIQHNASQMVDASIAVWPIQDVLRHAQRRGLHALLDVLDDQQQHLMTMVLLDGRIDWIELQAERLRRPLGQFFVDADMLAADLLEDVLQQQARRHAPIGEMLVERGLVQPEQVYDALVYQATTYLWDALNLRQGYSTLRLASPSVLSTMLKGRPRMQLDARWLIFDFFRRFPGTLAMWHPPQGYLLCVNSGILGHFSGFHWLPVEHWLLSLLGEARTMDGLSELAGDVGVPLSVVEEVLARCHELGIVSVVRRDEKSRGGSRG